MDQKIRKSMDLLISVSHLLVVMVQKLEKGINLEDFWMLTNIDKYGRISEVYEGDEKYGEYLPKILMLYFEYHKEIPENEMK